VTPPGGWVWRDSETGVLLRSVNLEKLLALINRHRVQNGLEELTGDVEEFEDMFCRKRVEAKHCIVPEGEEVVERQLADNMEWRVLDRTQTSLTEWGRKKNIVKSLDKIIRDSNICRKCEYNRALVCMSCLGYDTWVYGYIRNLPLLSELSDLKICGIDKVIILADIYRGDKLEEKEKSNGYPDGCWKKDK
jgi:hypothetical protein